jgi:hypothetical protein
MLGIPQGGKISILMIMGLEIGNNDEVTLSPGATARTSVIASSDPDDRPRTAGAAPAPPLPRLPRRRLS